MKKINLFQSLIFSLLIGFCYTATAGQENPEQKTGTRIVQHVHLNGIGGHNEFQRTNMREQYEACARDNDYAGLLVLPLPNGDVPKIISLESVDIDYGVNVTMTKFEGELYYLDQSDCGIRSIPHKYALLFSAVGECKIDYLKYTAKGQCDVSRHLNAGRLLTPDELVAQSFARLTPQQRAVVENALQNQTAVAHNGHVPVSPIVAGELKRIAGLLCQSYAMASIASKNCVANPAGISSIPVSSLNLEKAGLLLESTIPAQTLIADSVRLNQVASANLFSIPAGFTVEEIVIPNGSGQ